MSITATRNHPGPRRAANGKQYAYQILEKALALPPHGSPVDLEIRFYPEATLWEPTTAPVVSSTPKAFAYADGVIRLAARVHSFDRLYPEHRPAAPVSGSH